MTAAEHAAKASELLADIDALHKRLGEADPMDRMTMAADGTMAQLNRDTWFTLHLANAHASTAQALVASAGPLPDLTGLVRGVGAKEAYEEEQAGA